MDNNTLQTWVDLVIIIFCVGAVPFAIKVQSTLSGIQAILKEREKEQPQIDALHEKVQQLEILVLTKLVESKK